MRFVFCEIHLEKCCPRVVLLVCVHCKGWVPHQVAINGRNRSGLPGTMELREGWLRYVRLVR